jgi:hypothetical protein
VTELLRDRLRALLVGRKIEDVQVNGDEKNPTAVRIWVSSKEALFIEAEPCIETDIRLVFTKEALTVQKEPL